MRSVVRLFRERSRRRQRTMLDDWLDAPHPMMMTHTTHAA